MPIAIARPAFGGSGGAPGIGGVRFNPVGTPARPAGMAVPRTFKKGGVVRETGWAKVHKGEKVIPAAGRAMGGKKKKKVKSKKGKAKVKKVMHEWKKGSLHSGSKTGPVVKNQKQAVAIALSQARKKA
jgi:hypothetical protein